MTWLVLGGVAWCLASVAVAIVIGRMVVQRERQRPQHPPVDLPAQKGVRVEAPAGRSGASHSLASRLLRRR